MSKAGLLERFHAFAAENDLFSSRDTVVVGVSGGPDSAVLLHLLLQSDVECAVVHCNYGLRGDESDRDAESVADLCRQLNVPCEIEHAPAGWAESTPGNSMHEVAREIRYRLLEKAATSTGASRVAVGHHLDDQVETVLHRMMRGSGIRGLAAIRVKRPISARSEVLLIRPLLFASRTQIVSWAQEQGIVFRQDQSNLDERFERARIRKVLVPAIEQAFGEAGLRNIARTATQAEAAFETAVADRISDDLNAAKRMVDGLPALSVEALVAHEKGWRLLLLLDATRRWLRDVPDRASVAETIDGLLTAETGKRVALHGGNVWRDRNSIVFEASRQTSTDQTRIEVGEPVQFPGGTLLLERIPMPTLEDIESENPNVEVADDRILSQSLTAGVWKTGERFQPLGMTSPKKISDFLTDERVSSHGKANVLVVRSGAEVVWVVGYRLAQQFRLTAESKGAVRMRFEPGFGTRDP